jgi:hypothetical protein
MMHNFSSNLNFSGKCILVLNFSTYPLDENDQRTINYSMWMRINNRSSYQGVKWTLYMKINLQKILSIFVINWWRNPSHLPKIKNVPRTQRNAKVTLLMRSIAAIMSLGEHSLEQVWFNPTSTGLQWGWGWDFLMKSIIIKYRSICYWYNKKTARVCFLSGNITRVVFLAKKTTSAKKTTRVIFPLKKTHSCHLLFITCH